MARRVVWQVLAGRRSDAQRGEVDPGHTPSRTRAAAPATERGLLTPLRRARPTLALAAIAGLALLTLVVIVWTREDLATRPGSPAPATAAPAALGPTAEAPSPEAASTWSPSPSGTPGAPSSFRPVSPSAPAATAGAEPAPTGRPSATPAAPAITPAPPQPVVLLAAGDIADCGSDGDRQTAAILGATRGTIAALGDLAYEDGTAAQFRECYDPTWGRFIKRTRPVPGNHDYRTAGAGAYFDYFGSRAGRRSRGYYAYDLGGWRIYALNSNCAEIGGCGRSSPQGTWLRADLRDHPARCVLAYWHHPRYSSGAHGSQAFMDPIWDILYRASAEIVLAGHDHDYERFAPLSDAGAVDRRRGITEFVVGTGGREHRAFGTILAASRARNSTAWGVLRLTLSADGWASRFLPVAGRTFADRASGSCH